MRVVPRLRKESIVRCERFRHLEASWFSWGAADERHSQRTQEPSDMEAEGAKLLEAAIKQCTEDRD
jgi:hypothetical protein